MEMRRLERSYDGPCNRTLADNACSGKFAAARVTEAKRPSRGSARAERDAREPAR